MKPSDLPPPTEEAVQMAFFDIVRAHENTYPDLAFCFAVPNGQLRHPAIAGKLKAQGVKKGVLDVWFPIMRGGHPGLVIEFKRPRSSYSKPTFEQHAFINRLRQEGWLVEVHDNAEAAWNFVRTYLNDGDKDRPWPRRGVRGLL